MSSTGSANLESSVAAAGLANARELVALRRLGIITVRDLLWHAPMRYELEGAESSIAAARAAVAGDPHALITIRGSIEVVRVVRTRTARVEATFTDGDSTARLVWFNAPWMQRQLHPGTRGVCLGKARLVSGYLEMTNPRWTAEEQAPTEVGQRLRPIYPATEGLTTRRLEQMIGTALLRFGAEVGELLPEELRRARHLQPRVEALLAMHDGATLDQAERGRDRLAYDELLLLQLALAMRRWQNRSLMRAPALAVTAEIGQRIRARLPFKLTAPQEEAIAQISRDIASTAPMNRLLQGDVGSGKTAVAVYAMLAAVAHGQQAAIIAPTEILAEQHFRTVSGMLSDSRVRLELLVGGRSGAGKAAARERLATGQVDIVIGTHALLSEGVSIPNLALAVVDEQHRFGVLQRAALVGQRRGDPASVPHTLVMTATPIPRTLALAYFGDLDITTMPGRLPGRTPIVTRVVEPAKRPEVYAYLRRRVDAGDQVFVVVPAVEESPLGLRDVANHAKELSEGLLSGISIGSVHGRMPAAQRSEAMRRFTAGEDRVLVATLVIEVGVDVPAARMMVVEHAERFGLAQLHQLRGRIGRGTGRSLCVFIGEPVTPAAQQRLDAIGSTSDGFRLAELDLALRGPGESLGARQSGVPPFRVADLSRDWALLEAARQDAQEWIARSGTLGAPGEAEVRRELWQSYGDSMSLASVG